MCGLWTFCSHWLLVGSTWICAQVLAFGGGLTTTLRGGNIALNDATSVLAVLANSSLTLDSVSINNNLASAGIVFGYKAKRLAVVGTSIEDNWAMTGGCFMLVGSQANMRNTTFVRNEVVLSGGALVVDSSALNMTRCRFHSNMASVQRVSLTDPSALGSGLGGALCADGTALSITHSQFINNTGFMGGALHAQNGTSLEIQDSDFIGNGAAVGGALSLTTRALANISNSRFTNNRARCDKVVDWVDSIWFLHGIGGAISYNRARLWLTHSNFTGNRAVMDGGG